MLRLRRLTTGIRLAEAARRPHRTARPAGRKESPAAVPAAAGATHETPARRAHRQRIKAILTATRPAG